MANTNSNKFGLNGGRFYSFLNRPVLIDCNFTVDSTNGNGLGVRNLKGWGVQNVFMATSASFTGNTHSGTNVIDGISGGTASLQVGMPISGTSIPTGTTILTIASGTSITTSANSTGSTSSDTISYVGLGANNAVNPLLNTNVATTSKGYAWVQLSNNYTRYCGGFSGFVSPSTGSALNIDATDAALTVGKPYIISSVGHPAAGQASIVAVADSSGSLASTWFSLYDAYGNTWIVWFYVTGVGGSAPSGVSGTPIQVTIAENAANTAVAAALTSVLGLLQPPQVAGVYSFTTTTSGHTTLATNTSTAPYHLPGPPADGLIATGFTFSLSVNDHNLADWQGVGLPVGVTPNVGASFVAKATGSGSSTGQVVAVGVSGIGSIEVIGDANQSINTTPMGGSPNVGGWVLIQLLGPTSSSVTTPIPTAPTNNSVIGLSFYVEAGSVYIKGE